MKSRITRRRVGLQAQSPGDLATLRQQLGLRALVGDDEVRIQAGRSCVAAQDAGTERVEGVDPDITGRWSQERFQAPLHFLGRPVCEGDAQHLLRELLLRGYQPGGAPCDDVGLAAAGSGEHEHGGPAAR